MLKKYISKSVVSLSVALPGGGNAHVSFTARTGGGSVYYTDNVRIQRGLERHPKYGKLFREEESPAARTPAANTAGTAAAPTANAAGTVATKKKEPTLKEVKMRLVEDAKEFLASKYSVSRSKLRSKAACDEAAAQNGVKIIWEE